MSAALSPAAAAKIANHPLRLAILRALTGYSGASPSDIAEEFGQPLGNVSYHVRRLYELGAIELVRTRPVRGALEHFYRARVRVVIKVEEIER